MGTGGRAQVELLPEVVFVILMTSFLNLWIFWEKFGLDLLNLEVPTVIGRYCSRYYISRHFQLKTL